MIVLDASVLIAYLDRNDAHFDAAVWMLDDAAAEGHELAMSPITRAEVLVGPVRTGREKQALEAIADLRIAEEPLPPDAALYLARLRCTGLKMPDCCVLLAAATAQATLASFDDGLVKAAAKHQIPVRPLAQPR